MSRILAVGIATLDIINTVASYPPEDAEVRATSQRVCRGGNATNTLVVLSQLGHQCAWAGTLALEPDATHIRADLDYHKIDITAVKHLPHGKVPTSYIALSQTTASRTIVHYRDLPEYDFDSFAQLDLRHFDWLHFEGRNVAETEHMLVHARRVAPNVPISVEIEKPRDDIKRLFAYADVLLLSRHYCLARGVTTVDAVPGLVRSLNPNANIFLGWGTEGGYAWNSDNVRAHAPAFAPERVVDTLGAGDTFNAGVIDALLRDATVPDALTVAVRLAGRKCGMMGLAGL